MTLKQGDTTIKHGEMFAPVAAALTSLGTLDAAALQGLRPEFNRDLDSVRLIVLLSPT